MRKLLLIIISILISLLLISCDSFHEKYEYDSKPFLELLERDNVHKVTIKYLYTKDKLDVEYEYAVNDGDTIDETMITSTSILRGATLLCLYYDEKQLEPFDMNTEIHDDITLYALIGRKPQGIYVSGIPAKIFSSIAIYYYEKNDDNVIFVSSSKDYYQYRVILNSSSLIVISLFTGKIISYDSEILTKDIIDNLYKTVFNVNYNDYKIVSNNKFKLPINYYKMNTTEYDEKTLSNTTDGSIKIFHSQGEYSTTIYLDDK